MKKIIENFEILINRLKFEIIKRKVKKITGITLKINRYGYFDDEKFFNEFRKKYKIEGLVTPKEFIIDKWGFKFYNDIQSIHCIRIKKYKK